VEKEIEGFVPPTRKITFSELVEEKVVIFTGTTPEAYVQLQDTYEGLLRKKGYREQYDKSEVVLKEAENRLDIHIETRPSQSDEEAPASKSESKDEFDQKLARARQAGSTSLHKKKKAKEQQAQQQGATTAKKLTKLEKFQQKKSGYEMSITAIKRTLAVQVKKAFELFEFILGEDACAR